MDVDQLLAALAALAVPAPASFEETFRGPSLPWGGIATAEIRRLSARDIADALHLPIGNAVDFWTEASLFSACGYTALVYGPATLPKPTPQTNLSPSNNCNATLNPFTASSMPPNLRHR